MRILHLENGRSLYGGAQQVLYLMQELQALGIENHLLAPDGSAIADSARQLAIEVHTHNTRGELDWRLQQATVKLIEQQQIQLLHVHSRRGADFWGGRAARQCGIPAVLSRRVDNPESALGKRLKYPLYQRLIAISEAIGDVLVSGGLEPDKLRVVRSAVPGDLIDRSLSRHEFLKRFDLPPNSLVLAQIAQLIPRKGHKLLLDQLPSLLDDYPDLQVLLLGKGPEEATIRQQLNALRIADRVTLTGFQSDIVRLLPHFDLVVHPAHKEGLGVSLIQAAAAGCPLIGARAGGIPEIVRHDINGLLFEPGDAEGLDLAIRHLLDHPELRQKYGQAGMQLVQNEFSTRSMAIGNLAVYQELIGQGPQPLT